MVSFVEASIELAPLSAWAMEQASIYKPSVAASLCEPLLSTAAQHGVSRPDLFERLGLAVAAPHELERRVAADRWLEAWRLAMRQSDSPGLPVLVGRGTALAQLGPLGYALYTARTAEEALARLSRYYDLVDNTGRWRCSVEGRRVLMRWMRRGSRELGMRAANEQTLSSFVGIVRQCMGGEVEIEEVRFRHPRPASTALHEAHFGCPLYFEAAEDAVVLPADLLARIPIGADRLLSAYFQREVERLVERIAQDKSYASRVARAVSDLLCDGVPSCAQVAKRLDTSERTMRRRLRAEAQRYEILLAQIQRDEAISRLRAGASVREAALAAGFVDPSSFARAFRRWTGKSPSELCDEA